MTVQKLSPKHRVSKALQKRQLSKSLSKPPSLRYAPVFQWSTFHGDHICGPSRGARHRSTGNWTGLLCRRFTSGIIDIGCACWGRFRPSVIHISWGSHLWTLSRSEMWEGISRRWRSQLSTPLRCETWEYRLLSSICCIEELYKSSCWPIHEPNYRLIVSLN